jgi:hypothetical protein
VATHARARTRDERDLAGEVVRKVHGCFLTLDGSRAGGRSASCWRRTRPCAAVSDASSGASGAGNSSCPPSCISSCKSGSGPGPEPNPLEESARHGGPRARSGYSRTTGSWWSQPRARATTEMLKELQDGATEVVEDFTKPMPATAPRSRRQRLILTTRHPSWQRRSWSRGQKIVYTTTSPPQRAA